LNSIEQGATYRVIADILKLFPNAPRTSRHAIWSNSSLEFDLWFIQFGAYQVPGKTEPAGRNHVAADHEVVVDVRLDKVRYESGKHPPRAIFAKLRAGAKEPYTFIGVYDYDPPLQGLNHTSWKRKSSTCKLPNR
jgi:hypothetical protein